MVSLGYQNCVLFMYILADTFAHIWFVRGNIIIQEEFLWYQTPTFTIRLEDEGCRVKSGWVVDTVHLIWEDVMA